MKLTAGPIWTCFSTSNMVHWIEEHRLTSEAPIHTWISAKDRQWWHNGVRRQNLSGSHIRWKLAVSYDISYHDMWHVLKAAAIACNSCAAMVAWTMFLSHSWGWSFCQALWGSISRWGGLGFQRRNSMNIQNHIHLWLIQWQAGSELLINPKTIMVGALNLTTFFWLTQFLNHILLSTSVDQQIFTFVILPRWVPLAVLGNTIELSSSKGWRDEEEWIASWADSNGPNDLEEATSCYHLFTSSYLMSIISCFKDMCIWDWYYHKRTIRFVALR